MSRVRRGRESMAEAKTNLALRPITGFIPSAAKGEDRARQTHSRVHLFRHSAASILAGLTRDPLLVRDLLRHSRLSTTAGYVHTEVVAEGASEALADAIIGKGERVN